MSQVPRVYNLFPLLAGALPRWRSHVERAAAMGFTWIFANAFHQAGYSGSLYSVKDHYAVDARLVDGSTPPLEQLATMVREASELGLSVMMDLVINHTAFESPLIREHPDRFRRDAQRQIVHPGAKDGKRRVVWRDLAEADNAGSAAREALWAYWRRLAPHYAGDEIHLGPAGLLIAYEVKPDGQAAGIRADPVGTVPWHRSTRPSD